MTSNTCTIVVGPQGCGKTRNAERIARAYGCAKIVDDGRPIPRLEDIAPGNLILTNDDPDLGRGKFGFPVRVVTYKVAMEMVQIDEDFGARGGS